MKILLKSATIVDSSSKHHLKKRDVLIENGEISKIAASIQSTEKVKEISLKNLNISIVRIDSNVSFGKPGIEECETIENSLKTAALSRFTSIAVNANSFPVTDS